MKNILRNFRNLNLRTKFILYLNIFLVIVMSSGASFLIVKQENLTLHFIEEKGRSLTNVVAHMSADPVSLFDVGKLNNIVSHVLQDEDIAFVFFIDKDGNILNSLSDSISIPREDHEKWGISIDNKDTAIDTLMTNRHIVSFEEKILYDKNTIGKVVLGISKKDHSAETSSFVFFMVATTIAVIVIMGFLIYILFNRLVYKRLTQITETTKQISSGNLNVHVDIDTNDEIGSVSQSINHLSSNLNTIIRSMKELFSDIESTSIDINNRTDAMKNTVDEQSSLVRDITSVIQQNNEALHEITLQTDDFKSASEDTSASILELVSSSNEIASNMDTLFEEIENSTSSLQQISASLNSLVTAVNIVSKAVEDTSTSAEEINVSIKEIEKLSQKGNEITTGIKDHTENMGLQSIHKTIDGMKKVKETVELSGEVINILDSKSKEIDKILQVIDEVTDRTTLLSFNASILAAQAGSQGRAFAVVAGEIKTLANDTSTSTQEIAGIINMIRNEVKTAVQSIEQGIHKVTEGLYLAEEAGKIFNEITFLNQTSSDMSSRIEKATQEQAKGVDIVVRAVRSIEERISHLATVVKQQKDGMDAMLISIERMSDIAKQVKKSTDEQRRASSQISVSAESISNMSAALAISMKLTSESSSAIFDSLDQVKKNTEQSVSMASDMSNIVSNLMEKAQDLRLAIDKFKS